MDCSPPGSSVHGIFQAIVLEWIAISFSRGSSPPRDRTRVSCMVDRRFTVWATREDQIFLWAAFFFFFGGGWRQEYWSGLPFPSPGDLPDPGMKEISPTQELKPGLRHCRQMLYRLSQKVDNIKYLRNPPSVPFPSLNPLPKTICYTDLLHHMFCLFLCFIQADF